MQRSVAINTAQNVTIEYELASLRDRCLAWLIDVFVVTFAYIIMFQLINVVVKFRHMGTGWGVFLGLLPFLIYFLYNACFEIWNNGQTLGKKTMNIRVLRLDGKDPEWSDLLLRSVMHLVDSMFTLGFVGILLIKTTPKQQRLGDLAAHTTVIKLFSDSYLYRLDSILNIATSATYEPVFPQVKALSERDMIYIKTVLDRHKLYPNQAHHEVVEDLVTHLMPILQIEDRPPNRVEFLKTLLRDYIVLTR